MAEQMMAWTLSARWAPRQPGGGPPGRVERADQFWREPTVGREWVPVPEPAEDEVLVRVGVCGICGSDAHCAQTDEHGYVRFSGPASLPVVLGHELAGRVEKVGSRVKGLRPGQLVTAESVLWCGVCGQCRAGHPNQCERGELLGFTRAGALAPWVTLAERHCHSLEGLKASLAGPRELLRAAALVEPVGCAYNAMVVEAGGIRPGAFVVVYGAGPIGLASVMLARVAGAARVLVVEPQADRRRLALELGADHALDPDGTPGHIGDVLWRLTDRQGADLQIEAAGVSSTLEVMDRASAPRGTWIYLGRGGAQSSLAMDGLVTRAGRIVGSRGHAGGGVFPAVLRLMAAGRLPVEKMITALVPPEAAGEAIGRAGERRDGKILVEFNL